MEVYSWHLADGHIDCLDRDMFSAGTRMSKGKLTESLEDVEVARWEGNSGELDTDCSSSAGHTDKAGVDCSQAVCWHTAAADTGRHLPRVRSRTCPTPQV